jgi:hypothetical protein
MGVETVWIVDPKTRSGRMCLGSEWVEAWLVYILSAREHIPTLDMTRGRPQYARTRPSGYSLSSLGQSIEMALLDAGLQQQLSTSAERRI